MRPYFSPDDVGCAFECRYAFDWRASRKCSLNLVDHSQLLEGALTDVSQQNQFNILECSLYSRRIRAVISIRPFECPSRVTKLVKGKFFWALKPFLGNRPLWSRGSYLASNGHVTDAVIANYVNSQYTNHGMRLPRGVVPAR